MRSALCAAAFAMILPLGLPAGAGAQTLPPGVPAVMPFDIPYGTPISLAQAKKVAAAAEAAAQHWNWKEAVAIVDPDGELVFFERMDGTQIASIGIAEDKARAAARYRRPTKLFQDLVDHGHVNFLSLRGVVAAEGGLPLIVDGKLIGAIGCSGGTSPQDQVIAVAGAAALK
jgi:glc operon protein GlcG